MASTCNNNVHEPDENKRKGRRKKPRGAGDKKVCGGRQWREPHHQQREMTRDTRRLCHRLYCCCCRRPSFLKRWKRPKRGGNTPSTGDVRTEREKVNVMLHVHVQQQQPISAPLPPSFYSYFACVSSEAYRLYDQSSSPPTHHLHS